MYKKFIFPSLLVAVLAVTVSFFYFNDNINLTTISILKFNGGKPSAGFVKYPISASIEGDWIQMEINVMAKGRKQQAELQQIMPAVQSEFLLSVSEKKMKKNIQERNFEAIRLFILKEINSRCSIPVTKIYFDSFNLIKMLTI